MLANLVRSRVQPTHCLLKVSLFLVLSVISVSHRTLFFGHSFKHLKYAVYFLSFPSISIPIAALQKFLVTRRRNIAWIKSVVPDSYNPHNNFQHDCAVEGQNECLTVTPTLSYTFFGTIAHHLWTSALNTDPKQRITPRIRRKTPRQENLIGSHAQNTVCEKHRKAKLPKKLRISD